MAARTRPASACAPARGVISYADLVRVLRDGGAEPADVAQWLGYTPGWVEWSAPEENARPPSKPRHVSSDAAVDLAPQLEVELPFWQPFFARFARPVERAGDERQESRFPQPSGPWSGLPAATPEPRLLAAWNKLLPRLRAAIAVATETGGPDIPRVVDNIARLRMLDRIPHRRVRRWGQAIQVIVDNAPRLNPFAHDQGAVLDGLETLFAKGGVEQAGPAPADGGLCIASPGGALTAYRPPSPGTVVLALSDLGCLARSHEPETARWAALGQALREAGCIPVALTPAPPERWARNVTATWILAPWETSRPPGPATPSEIAERADRLARLASIAIRLEPGLLRELRLLIGADAGAEADLWRHPAIAGRSVVAATFDRERAKALRAALFDAEPDKDLIVRAVLLLRDWRGGQLAPEIWLEEA